MISSVSARIVLMALAQLAIGVWVFLAASELLATTEKLNANAIRGQAVWRASGCSSCHALFGLGGHMGPDLTNVVQRRGAAHVQSVMRHGLGRMPAGLADEADIDAVTQYLSQIDRLAVYPIPSYWDGVFGQPKKASGQRDKQ